VQKGGGHASASRTGRCDRGIEAFSGGLPPFFKCLTLRRRTVAVSWSAQLTTDGRITHLRS
jgi:hypothetical protein